MCSKFKLYSALLLLSLTISVKPITAKLEEDIASAASANTVQAKFGFLKKAWLDLKNVKPYNIGSMVYLQKNVIIQLKDNTSNLPFTLAQRRSVDRFDAEIRNLIISSCGEVLSEVLNIKNEDSLNVDYMQSFAKSFEHDPGTALKIYEHAIDKIYGIKKTSILAQYLSAILSNKPEQTAELQVDVQHYLYRDFLNRADIDDEYMLDIASYLRYYKFNLAPYLSRERRQRMDQDIASLPPTLYYLFFAKTPVCMKNVGYNEFLYEFKAAHNADKPEVFTRPNQGHIGVAGHWGFEISNQTDSAGDLIYIGEIKNVNFQHVLYRDEMLNNRVFASVNPGPANGVWHFNLRNNNLVLAQGDFLLCATNTAGDSWRHVYAVQSTVDDALCQWSLNICPPMPTAGK